MTIKIAQISCGTAWSGIQNVLEQAASIIGAQLVYPEVDLEYIKKASEEFGLEVDSANLKLMIARAMAISHHISDADAAFIVTCFRCAEGALVRHEIRRYLQQYADIPVIMYAFTEHPKTSELVIRLEALATVVKSKALLARQKQEGLTLGIDSGSSTTKAIVMQDNEIIGVGWFPTTDIAQTAELAVNQALGDAGGLNINQIEAIGVTGYGRFIVGQKFHAALVQEELTVNSKGAVFLADRQKGEATVIDIGGLDNKVITLLNGIPDAFTVGGICAGSSGRFLELAASRIGLPILEFGELALKGTAEKVKLDSYCSIFGIQDLVSKLAEGRSREDVAAAACHSVAEQVFTQQLQEIDLRDPIIEVGGTSLIKGLVFQMKEVLGRDIIVPKHSPFAGAVGAALLSSGMIAK
ncbi:MAG TPA: methanogenesis marker 15 protein [Candidatus Deferrimicrobium sp.]|nr:methanogenesis marker 15 protein [Candidatus Deferrimicrobium sp.]